jgi:hypothetical protein
MRFHACRSYSSDISKRNWFYDESKLETILFVAEQLRIETVFVWPMVSCRFFLDCVCCVFLSCVSSITAKENNTSSVLFDNN